MAPYWLLAPAVAGLAWMLAAGPGEALAGFAAGPSSVLGHLTGAHAALHVARPLAAFAGLGGWLPRQFPVALPLAAAEAALAGWLDWLHTDEWAVPPPRPGAVAALRAARAARRIRSGAVLTRDGVALGITPSNGAVIGLTWQEVSRGRSGGRGRRAGGDAHLPPARARSGPPSQAGHRARRRA